MRNSRNKLSPLLVLIAGILWGMIGLFVRKLNLWGFASMDIVALRAITTSILLFVFLWFFDKEKLKIKLKDIWCFIGTGVFSIVFFNCCYFKAITLTSLSVAAILLYTAPAIVMILSVLLFRERITGLKVLSLIMTLVGCGLVTGVLSGRQTLNAYGVLVGLGAGFGYALYSIFSRFALDRGYHSLTISFYTFVFAMFATIPFANYSSMAKICKQDYKVILFCFLFGLLSTVLPYIAYTSGLKGMENSKASIIASIEPVAATLLGVILYHERLSVLEVIGITFVLFAISMNNFKSKNED